MSGSKDDLPSDHDDGRRTFEDSETFVPQVQANGQKRDLDAQPGLVARPDDTAGNEHGVSASTPMQPPGLGVYASGGNQFGTSQDGQSTSMHPAGQQYGQQYYPSAPLPGRYQPAIGVQGGSGGGFPPYGQNSDQQPKKGRGALIVWILLGIFLILAATVGVLFGLGVIGSDDAELSVELTDREGTYGSDSELDALWDTCADGDLAACDELYENAVDDSAYRVFGNTCGETSAAQSGGCEEELYADAQEPSPSATVEPAPEPSPTPSPEPSPTPAPAPSSASAPAPWGSYGSDTGLDGLWDLCAGGDMVSCDDLYWLSPVGSAYEAFGSTCGQTTESLYGECDLYDPSSTGWVPSSSGWSYGDDPALDALWDGCAAGDWDSCHDLWWDARENSEYEYFAGTCGYRGSYSPGWCDTRAANGEF